MQRDIMRSNKQQKNFYATRIKKNMKNKMCLKEAEGKKKKKKRKILYREDNALHKWRTAFCNKLFQGLPVVSQHPRFQSSRLNPGCPQILPIYYRIFTIIHFLMVVKFLPLDLRFFPGANHLPSPPSLCESLTTKTTETSSQWTGLDCHKHRLTNGSRSVAAMLVMITKYLMITFKLEGQQETSAAHRASISRGCSSPNCRKNF